MSKESEHTFIDAIADAVVAKMPNHEPLEIKLDDLGVVPMRVYTAKEAADLLGSHVSSIRQIPEEELPKHRRAGKGIGYYGINILLYQNGLPPIDIRASLEAYRQALMRDRPSVSPLRAEEQRYTRVQ